MRDPSTCGFVVHVVQLHEYQIKKRWRMKKRREEVTFTLLNQNIDGSNDNVKSTYEPTLKLMGCCHKRQRGRGLHYEVSIWTDSGKEKQKKQGHNVNSVIEGQCSCSSSLSNM